LFYSRIAVEQRVMSDGGHSVIPYFMAGGDWVSEIVLVNPSRRKVFGKIIYTFVDSPTERRESRILEYSVPARGLRRFRISGGQKSRSGYAVLQPGDHTSIPLTSALLLHKTEARPTDDALIEAVAPRSVHTLYVERNDGLLSTDVVMTNPSNKKIVANLKLSTLNDGQNLVEQSITLSPFGMQTVTLDELDNSPFRPKSFEGVLRIESGDASEIAAVSVRRAGDRTKQVIYSLIPSLEALPRIGKKSVLLPQIVDSGGYISHLVLFNTFQKNSAVALGFFSNSGEPMPLLIN
jgi:hypothetical protein